MCQAALILHPALLLSLLPPSFRRDPNQSISRCSLFLRGCLLLESRTRTTTLFHGDLGPKVARLTFLTSPNLHYFTLQPAKLTIGVVFARCSFSAVKTEQTLRLLKCSDYDCLTSVDFELSASHSFGCKSTFSPR
jgi:hypothetical protein